MNSFMLLVFPSHTDQLICFTSACCFEEVTNRLCSRRSAADVPRLPNVSLRRAQTRTPGRKRGPSNMMVVLRFGFCFNPPKKGYTQPPTHTQKNQKTRNTPRTHTHKTQTNTHTGTQRQKDTHTQKHIRLQSFFIMAKLLRGPARLASWLFYLCVSL